MSTQFVLAFGGTGARCVEALVHLMASGAIKDSVRVLVIDLDENNYNVTRALDQLERYRAVRAQIDTQARSHFFGAELKADEGEQPFFWKYHHVGRWADMLGYRADWKTEGNEDPQSGLYELLYEDAELQKADFHKGYVGLAHIGALHMFKIFREAAEDDKSPVRKFLNHVRQAATSDNVKVTVFGSIFGGTGASGIPAVPYVLDTLPMFKEVRSKIEVGGVMLAPYFLFPAPPTGHERGPDSQIHPLTAQASLYHYTSGQTGYNRFYLLGAPQEVETNPTWADYGQEQKNDPHYVEVAAAMAARHFFDDPPSADLMEQPKFFACNTDSVADWKFPYGDHSNLRTHMLTFTSAALIHARYVDPGIDDQFRLSNWRKDLKLDRNVPGYSAFTRFCYRYLHWSGGLARLPGQVTERSALQPLNVTLFNPALASVVSVIPDPRDQSEAQAPKATSLADIGCAVSGENPEGFGQRLHTAVFDEHLGTKEGGLGSGSSPLANYLLHLETPVRKVIPEPQSIG